MSLRYVTDEDTGDFYSDDTPYFKVKTNYMYSGIYFARREGGYAQMVSSEVRGDRRIITLDDGTKEGVMLDQEVIGFDREWPYPDDDAD